MTLDSLITSNRENFRKHFGENPSFVAFAPGRINIIGEHTDYNEGLSLPCAINRWVTVSVKQGGERRAESGETEQHVVKIFSENFNNEMKITLGEQYAPERSWEKYIYGCIQTAISHKLLAESNPGFNALISGNVPVGSGVSSSAALEVAFMNALSAFRSPLSALRSPLSALFLIKLCQEVEHRYLGVKSGLLDQYASQFSVAGKAMLLDFKELNHRFIPALSKGYAWVLCDTKIKRELAAGSYSLRVEETRRALTELMRKRSHIKGFRDIKEEDLPDIENPVRRKRIKHYVTENKRTLAAAEALEKNDMKELGMLLTASHISLKNDYEVSCPELDFLAHTALRFPHCLGSRMMGGGFGGCTLNLVDESKTDQFAEYISSAYRRKTGMDTELNIYHSVDGAGIYKLKVES